MLQGPFGLKNASATYQGMVTQIFDLVLGRTLDAYINDIVIKSKRKQYHIKDLTEMFTIVF